MSRNRYQPPKVKKKIPFFNSVSDKENILFSITIFSLSSLRYFPRSFKNPIHICKPPPKSSHMVTLLAPIFRAGVENADGKYHVNHLIIVSQVRIVQISWNLSNYNRWIVEVRVQSKYHDALGVIVTIWLRRVTPYCSSWLIVLIYCAF